MSCLASFGGTDHAQKSRHQVEMIILSSSVDLTDGPITFHLQITFKNKFKLKMGLNNWENSGPRLRRNDMVTEVFSGRYHMEKITKMNSSNLRQLVLRLVEFTATQAGTSKQTKPVWWPRNMSFHCTLDLDGISTKQGMKEFRNHLQYLILSCCKFFRNCQQDIQLCHETWINDENFKPKGLKRHKSPIVEVPPKRRRTLICKNESEDVKKPVVVGKPKWKPVQSDFLHSFQLEVTDSVPQVRGKLPANLRTPKIHSCPHIPLSSDIGRAIMEQENYSVPEYVITRKLERLEWYVNKDIPKPSGNRFEVSYVESKKNKYIHTYKFPIRQFHQKHGNIVYKNMLLRKCRPLQVVVENEDLLVKKWNLLDVSITVPKLPSHMVSKYLSDKEMCNENNDGIIDS